MKTSNLKVYSQKAVEVASTLNSIMIRKVKKRQKMRMNLVNAKSAITKRLTCLEHSLGSTTTG